MSTPISFNIPSLWHILFHLIICNPRSTYISSLVTSHAQTVYLISSQISSCTHSFHPFSIDITSARHRINHSYNFVDHEFNTGHFRSTHFSCQIIPDPLIDMPASSHFDIDISLSPHNWTYFILCLLVSTPFSSYFKSIQLITIQILSL